VQANFTDFGELYRAAFAECNSRRKVMLLHQVQETIESWERKSAGEAPGEASSPDRIPPQPSVASPQFRRAA